MSDPAPFSTWLRPRAHDAGRSLDLVRIAVGFILLTHPLNLLLHPELARDLGRSLEVHGFPWGAGSVYAALALQLACSLALIAGRLVVPAAAGSIVVLAAGMALLYAPFWYVAGGESVDGHPGMEFNVLLIACLSGVLRASWSRRAGVAGAPDESSAESGLAIVRVASALLILPHALAPFVTWDLAGMREWGEGMGRLGFPFGVPLVWSVVSLQAASSFALLARRFVVPASAGHILVLTNGIWISHAPHWFMVGPENNGMEFPLTFIACFAACLLAFWPKRDEAKGAASWTRTPGWSPVSK